MWNRIPRSDSENARPWRTTGEGTPTTWPRFGMIASAARPEIASPRFILPASFTHTFFLLPQHHPFESGPASRAACSRAACLSSMPAQTCFNFQGAVTFVWSCHTDSISGSAEAMRGMHSTGIRAALLAALVVGSAGKIVNKARTQELFHTPYREEDSRHFKVLPSALVWASLCYSCGARALRASVSGIVSLGEFAGSTHAVDMRCEQIEDSATFHADAEKRFDLSYADGSELKGFNAHDIVHVRALPMSAPPVRARAP